jgi:hypothetical protein
VETLWGIIDSLPSSIWLCSGDVLRLFGNLNFEFAISVSDAQDTKLTFTEQSAVVEAFRAN